MRGRAGLVVTLCLVAFAFGLVDMGLAGGVGGGPQVMTKVDAKLEPCCGEPEPGAKGQVMRKAKMRQGVIQRDEFKAMVRVPIPSRALGIVDAEMAEAADIRLILLHRDGTPYAECLLEFDDIEAEDDDGETKAEYKVDVRLRLKKGKPILEEHKGVCDTDLKTDGIQSGAPDAEGGDRVIATVVNDPDDRVDFLEGTLQGK